MNRVWTSFIEDLGSPENELPMELRANLISIGLWLLQGGRGSAPGPLREFRGPDRGLADHPRRHPMKNTLKISLKPNEKIYINGAVLQGRPQGDDRTAERRAVPAREPCAAGRRGVDAAAPALFHPAGHADEPERRRSRPARCSGGRCRCCWRASPTSRSGRAEAHRPAGRRRPCLRRAEGDPRALSARETTSSNRAGRAATTRPESPPAARRGGDISDERRTTCRQPRRRPALTTETKSKTAVDYESFLKLLVAQMKNQDPTKPMEFDRFRGAARDLLAGRAVRPDRTPSSTRSCSRRRCRRPAR